MSGHVTFDTLTKLEIMVCFDTLCVPQFVGQFQCNLVRFDSYAHFTLHKHSGTKRAKHIFHDIIVDISFATSVSTNWCREFWRVHWPSNPGPGWFETPARTQDLETPAKAQDCRCELGVTDTCVGEDTSHEAYGMGPQTLHKPSAYALPMDSELAETKRDGWRFGSQANDWTKVWCRKRRSKRDSFST